MSERTRPKGGAQVPGLSPLWTTDFEKIDPYDWTSRRRFPKEARVLLQMAHELVDRGTLRFHLDDRSREKAVWMLHEDALGTLQDCVELLEQGKHRLVGKMFRDVVETIDLAVYFSEEAGAENLAKWYEDETIPHRKYREYLRHRGDPALADQRRVFYIHLSRWTHHTYRALANAFSLGKNDFLVCDSHAPELLVLPQTITQYMWMLAHLILFLLGETRRLGALYEAPSKTESI